MFLLLLSCLADLAFNFQPGEEEGEGNCEETTAYLVDEDDDGYGTEKQLCEAPGSVVATGQDCDDSDSSVHPDADELCDERDNDCDDTVDEDSIDGSLWFEDYDDDGYGGGDGLESCEPISGLIETGGDCDDDDDEVFPGASEICNDKDDDCDDTIDEAGAEDVLTWYLDQDDDGYGVSDVTTVACSVPEGFSSEGGDCDDTRDSVYPGSHETEVPFDGTDTDCDGKDYCTDLNCDAWPDIVAPSLWDEGGSFETSSTIFWGSESGYSNHDSTPLDTLGAFSVESADLDQNGYPDLVFSGVGSDDTSKEASLVYYNSSVGFISSETLMSYGAVDVCIEDLDQNGWEDVVLVGWVDDNDHITASYVHYNSPTGFVSNVKLSHRGSYHCLLADADEDGSTDLILGELTRETQPSNPWTSFVRVHWNKGVFANNTKLSLNATGPRRGAVDDVDGDGTPDLIFAEYYNGVSPNVNSSIWYGFSDTEHVALPTLGATDLVVEDLDADGYKDLVFSNLQSETSYAPDSYIYWGTADGFSTTDRTGLPTNGASWVTSQDLDGDGYTDLLFSCLFDGSYSTYSLIYWGNASGYSTTKRTKLPTEGAFRHTVHDLNGDGYPEILFNGLASGEGNQQSQVEIFWGSASGYGSTDLTELTVVASYGVPLVVGP